MSSSSTPLLNTNDTLHQWSQTLKKLNPEVQDILVTMPLPGRNLSVDFAALHYNSMFKSHNITSSIDGFHFNHQLIAGRYMVFNDILLLMHEPGTGKTRTQLYAMMNVLTAGLIKKILIINRSSPANEVAIQTLKVLYQHEFIRHFEMPFGKFVEQYIETRTIKKLNGFGTDPYTGIIIDEAHGINTEDESAKTAKSDILTSFIATLSGIRGIKMILATATPIFGNVNIVHDYMRLFFHSENPKADYGITDFVSSMVSYTMINYDHIKIRQVMNDEDTIIQTSRDDAIALQQDNDEDAVDFPTDADAEFVRESTGALSVEEEHSEGMYTNGEPRARGDKSFKLDDGYGEYKLHLFMSKPAPMQIADLAKISMMSDPTRRVVFFANVKPIMVRSARPADPEKYQAAILDEIIRRGNETPYGVIVIYCDIKKDGANNVAEYFREKYGIKAYDANERKQSNTKGYSAPKEVREIDSLIIEYRTEIRNLYSNIPKVTKTEIIKMGEVIAEYEKQQVFTNQNYIYFADLSFSANVILKMKERYEILKLHAKEEDEIMEKINELERQIEELTRIRTLKMKDYTTGMEMKNKQHKYFIFEPSMNSSDKVIFEKINSPENWDGSLVKYVIGSRVMRDGTDIKHGVQIHIIIPEWRIPGLVQAQHRIIRSNGHNEIIRQLAIRMVEDAILAGKEPPTRAQAQAIIRKEGIKVEIYNHLLDVDAIKIEDVKQASKYFTRELDYYLRHTYNINKGSAYPNDVLATIRDAIQSSSGSRGGMKLYDAAIRRHVSVGKKQIQMRSSAIDYILNVRTDLRQRLRQELDPKIQANDPVESTTQTALGATEMFFADYHIKRITESVKALLLKENVMNTDEIVKHLLNENSQYSVQVIATAIKFLVERDKYIYNDNMGINMIIHLYTTKTDSTQGRFGIEASPRSESILYLSTNEDPNSDPRNFNHPYNKRVNALRISLIEEFKREPTTIDETDLIIPKRAEAFYKLYDLIERATRPGYQINELEYEFLVQMSEYWMVLEKDILDKTINITDMTFYVIEKHIDRPSIDILSKNLLVHEFDARPTVRRWKVKYTLSVRDQRFVRFAQLAQNYAAYDPTSSGEGSRANGLIMTKSVYSDPPPPKNPMELRRTEGEITHVMRQEIFENSLTYRLLQQPSALIEPYESRVVIKESGVLHTKGYQISQDQSFSKLSREGIIKYIHSLVTKDMYLLFFLYNSIGSDKLKFRNYSHTLVTIKEYEQSVIELAKAGTPTPMFQIEYVEKNFTPAGRIEQYKLIYADRP